MTHRSVLLGLATAAALALAPATNAQEDPVLSLLRSRDALGSVSFARVVQVTTGHKVRPLDPRRHRQLLTALSGVFEATLTALNAPGHPIHRAGRVNEASRYLEDEIRRQLNLLPGWSCTVPLTAEGREQRSGYPDLRVHTDRGVVFFLDPKLYRADSRTSSLRTFYYEPRTLTGKIHEDALHLLVGFAHTGNDARTLHLVSWELIDLSRLTVQLKAEFQASNRDVYQPGLVIKSSAPAP